MSLAALFEGAVNELQGQSWSPEVRRLVDTLSAIFSSETPIQLTQPLVIENHTAQAAIQVIGNADSRALEITTAGGQQASMGVGLGNTGLVANEYIPLSEYMLSPEVVQQFLSVLTGKGGGVTLTPGSLPATTRPYNLQPASAPGNLPANTPTGVGGITNQTASGRGRPTGYQTPVQIPPATEQEVSSGGGIGSGGGAPSGRPILKLAGQIPKVTGRATGSGKPGQSHTMQVLTPWSEVFGFARHGDLGLEVCVGNTRYFWPKVAGGLGTGLTTSLTVVTAVSCNAGSLSVTTQTWTFTDGVLTNVT